MGLFPRVPTDRYRGNFGVNPLNSYEIHEMFSEEKLKEAARTGRPIEIFVGFNVSDAYHNGETIKSKFICQTKVRTIYWILFR